ncbi:MAG: MFS transporter [Promethearchaeota archaeon]
MNDADVTEIDDKIRPQDDRHSRGTYLSFGSYQITWTVIVSTLNLFLFFYYHAVLGLEPWLILLATVIYTVWDAINEPVVAYLLDRNFKFTRKWGRRFPWIVVSIIPLCLSLYLVFTAPAVDARVNPWPVFWWLVMSMAIFDLFITILDVNAGSLRADKFRTETERRRYSGYFGPMDMISMVIGMIVPPLFLGLGEGREAFSIMAAFIAVIGIICGILFIPGAREDKIIIDRYFAGDYERMGFLEGIKEVMKQKSFIAFWISYSTFGMATTLMTAMSVYVVVFILRADIFVMTFLFALFLLGALISVPLWLHFLKKSEDAKKVYTIGGIVLAIAMIPLLFFQSLLDLMIVFFILGLSVGCIWTLGVPYILSNVQDDYVVRTEKNQKGVILGTWAFVGRFVNFMDELIIAIVFTLVGFKAGYDTYDGLANAVDDIGLVLLGIRLLVSIIPMCVLLIGVVVFWKLYPLTKEKVLENREKLNELGF